MEPNAINIRDIAIYDPVAAYGIMLGIPRVPFQMNAVAIFNTFSTSQLPVEGDLDATIAQRTWIDKIDYSLQQPNVFSGQVFKTLYDSMLKAQPGISVKVTVQSGPRYVLSQNPVPIENFVDIIQSRWPAGWPLYKQQSIGVQFFMTQAPPSTSPNAPPYNVTLTFTGWQFLDHTIELVSPAQAAAALNQAGIECPAIGAIRTAG